MKLTVVGCSGSGPGPDSAASCYLVQAPYKGRTFSMILDCGPGAFGALYRHLDPRDVDAVGLSHLHPDHCLDLCAYYVAARYSPTAPWSGSPVFGPTGTAQRLLRAYDAPAPRSSETGQSAGTRPSIAEHFDYRQWQPEQQVGPFRVDTVRVEHPGQAYAIRVEEVTSGRSLVYSGDTGPCAALRRLATATDLLLVEASFMAAADNPSGMHLSGPDATRIASAAGVRAVVLTHIPPWHDPAAVLAEAAPHFGGPVAVATSGASWTMV